MPTNLTLTVVEESTLVVHVAFFDEDGASVAPATLTWSLMTRNGAIVNLRTNVAVPTPTATLDIVLSGDDLTAVAAADNLRILLLEGTYNSTAGIGLKLKDSVTFHVADQIGVT